MAVESARVTADVVEVSEYPEMARRYDVTSVPKVVLNDAVELLGSQSEETLVASVWRLGRSDSDPTTPPIGLARYDRLA